MYTSWFLSNFKIWSVCYYFILKVILLNFFVKIEEHGSIILS